MMNENRPITSYNVNVKARSKSKESVRGVAEVGND
jgi:hypothetical protein